MKKLYQAIKNAIGIVLLRWALGMMTDELIYRLGLDIAEEMQPYRKAQRQ